MNSSNISIDHQEVSGNGTLYNIAKQENILYDDPFEYFFKIPVQQDMNLEKVYQLIKYIVNKDRLKFRFMSDPSRYKEMIETIKYYENNANDAVLVCSTNLDDGYKSIISSILNICSMFHIENENEATILKANNNSHVIAFIEALALKINFINIDSRKTYTKCKKFAEELKQQIMPFLSCSNQYGNFLQFSDVYIEAPSSLPFIDKEVRFTTSDNIIPKLIQPLYGDSPECGLRELIQNACDACKLMKNHEFRSNPIVEIHLNKESASLNWILTIRDYGIGMSEDILINKYFVIGESTKRTSNENLVGQFGIGALATFLLGNKMNLKTKKFDSNTILSFEYEYILDDNTYTNNEIDIVVSNSDNFKSGTEVKITLKDTFNDYDIEEIEELLKINEWYLMSDIELAYYVNGSKKEILTLKSDEYIWEPVISNDNLKVEYLVPDSERNDRRVPYGKVIYNGILIPEKYILHDKYLKYVPCINIVDTGRNIEVDLSRKEIHNANIFSSKLENTLYSKTISLLMNDEVRENIINDLEIISFTYENEYMKSIPLFFCRDGFGIYSAISLKRIERLHKYKYLIRVFNFNKYGNKINLSDLNSDCIYIFDYQNLEKSYLSYLISSIGTTIIPAPLFKTFFYSAYNSNTGFKKDTIKDIYKCLNKQLPVNDSAREVWDYHNKYKEQLFNNLFNNDFINISKCFNDNVDVSNIHRISKNCIIKISEISNIYYDSNSELIKLDEFGVEMLDYLRENINEDICC